MAIILQTACILAQAGEVLHASANHKQGHYLIDVSFKVVGERDTIYEIMTDYNQLMGLSDVIISSAIVEPDNNNIFEGVRIQFVTETCVLFLCFKADLVEDLTVMEDGTLKALFVPELSDFEYGEVTMQVQKIDDTHTRINFMSNFKPKFWVPPIIGPIVVKRKAIQSAKYTILEIEKIANDE